MAWNSGDPEIAAHITAICSRSMGDADQLIASIVGRCWPGGTADRSERIALEWVRHWGPAGVPPAGPDCECRAGRCDLCN